MGLKRAWASPLGRARQTADIHKNALGLDVEYLDDLREVSFGDFECHTLDQLEEKYPGEWAKRQADRWNYRPPGGESNKDAVPRARRVAERIGLWSEPEPLLIVAHFAINRLVIAELAGVSPGETMVMNVPHEVIYRLSQNGIGWNIDHKHTLRVAHGFQAGWIKQETNRSENDRSGNGGR